MCESDRARELWDHGGVSTLQIAAVQFSAGPDPADNLERIGALARTVAGAELIVFPEASMARFGTRLTGVAEPLDGRFADGVRALAAELGSTLVVGMFTPAVDDTPAVGDTPAAGDTTAAGAPRPRVRNTVLITGPGGEWVYHKIHLYDAFGGKESTVVQPGAELVTFGCGGLTVGVATCYDLRFADQFTALGQAGAELVVVPASWGDGPGKAEQWDLLTRVRAMDAQSWLLASDQPVPDPLPRVAAGSPLGVGRSTLVDPLGGLRARLDHRPGVLVATVDSDTVEQARALLPLL